MFKTYYRLTKPGIIYANVMTAAAGFLLASPRQIKFGLLLAVACGMALVIASACVFNNYIDRGIDAKMARTRKRAIVSGRVSGRTALVYASALGLAGFIVMWFWVNRLTLGIGLIAFIDYVILYGLAKRRSVYGTLVGSVAGAAPVVAGYTAVSGQFNKEALILFLVLAFWQMPHFYAIALYRLKDYQAAGLPVWPAKKGAPSTKIQILLFIAAFIVANILLFGFGYVGYSYLVVMAALGLGWQWIGWRGFKVADDRLWGKQMFLYSLIVILVLSAMLSVGSRLA